MSDLKKLQQDFVHDCLGGAAEFRMADRLEGGRISAEGQMGIYRDSAIGNIITAMKITYPLVENLVGENFFAMSCAEFIKEHWPGSGNMSDYGAAFPAFLGAFELAKALPYLADMARLDWAFHESSLADDAEAFDWGALAQVPEEKIGEIKIELHPSVRLLSSKHPVLKIRELCMESGDDGAQLDLSKAQGVNVLLVRKDLRVDLYPVSDAEMAFLEAIRAGGSLFEGFEAGLAVDAEEPMEDKLAKHIEIGTFCGFL